MFGEMATPVTFLLAKLLAFLLLLNACAQAGGSKPADSAAAAEQVWLTIDVSSLLEHQAELSPAKLPWLPECGYLLQDTAVGFSEGQTAFATLENAAQEHEIMLDFSMQPGRIAYVRGIGQLYEQDCGSGSGWLYTVNGESPGVAASLYELEPGDTITWIYTCDLGRDVGLE